MINSKKLSLRCNEKESEILALLGRVSFALQIIFNKPSELIAHFSLLPKVIFRFNVLTPAIVYGHPFQRVYSDAIERLVAACNNAGIPILIAVAEAFLNEIVFHRKLAVDEVNEMELDDSENLYEHIQLHGASSNVFIHAYSSLVKTLDFPISFEDFLQQYAPYDDMQSIKNYV